MEWFIFSVLSSFQSIKRFEIPVWGSAESSHYLSLKCNSFPKDSLIFYSVHFNPATTSQPPSCLAPPPDEALLGSKDGWDMLSVKIWWWGWESDPSEKFSIISASYGCNQEINSDFLEGLALELSLAGWPQMEEFGGIGWDAFRDWEIWGMPGFSEGHHNYYHSAVAVYRYIILFSPYNTKWHFFRQWREWVAAPAPPAT